MSARLKGTPVAILGAGLMGHGIAQVFAEAGAEVRVHDAATEALTSLPARVRSNLRRLGRDQAIADRIGLCPGLGDAVAGAELVIESAPEDLRLKQKLFEQVDRLAPRDAILATNTSVIPVTDIARPATAPGRIVGTHWWNPPYLIPLVEVVQAAHTSDGTVRRTIELLREAGKSPVHVRRDVPGFVGNRLQHAMWREAIALIAADVCDAKTVDTVVKQSFGMRLAALGPLENADLIGLDLTLAIHEQLLPHIDHTPGPSPYLRNLVDTGRLGIKAGEGFHRWLPEQAEALKARLTAHLQTITNVGAPSGAIASGGEQ
jgi:3-hydroxybutyryl-CoA dehydrogenase